MEDANKVDSKILGHKNSIPLEPYLKWVRTRTQSLMMPYPSILPVIMMPYPDSISWTYIMTYAYISYTT